MRRRVGYDAISHTASAARAPMDDSAELRALRAAVLAQPDDDLPRLVYADWLDESGDPDRARFLRAQIALAALPEWDPQATALRRTQPEWDLSEARRAGLPPLPEERGLRWPDADRDAFRRGFGYWAKAPMLTALQTELPRLLKREPIERLGLFAATLDQWRAFAVSPWLPRIREIDFDGIGAPIEAMRELVGAPGANGLRTLRFQSSISPAMPEILSRLLRSPLGDRLTALHLSQAFGSDAGWFEDFQDAFRAGGERLEELHLHSMGFGGVHLHEFLISRAWTNLRELTVANDAARHPSLSFLGYPDAWPALHSVRLSGVHLDFADADRLAQNLRAPGLTVLDLALSPILPEAVRALAKAEHLAPLRVVRLRRMRIDNRGVRYLARAKFWKNLVELDLRGNPVDENGTKFLLERRPPPELELLTLDRNFSQAVCERLQDHFGGKVVFAEK